MFYSIMRYEFIKYIRFNEKNCEQVYVKYNNIVFKYVLFYYEI